jgi:lysophospholipase L1-like esterase
VVALFPNNVVLVDIHAAFLGRSGLLLIEKHGAAPDQIHPTDAGYLVMAQAFEDAIRAN